METDIYVFNSAGCHGHYLTYLIDRLSKKSPPIKELPFNQLGNSHNKIDYSGFSQYVNVSQQYNYKNLKNKKIIKIVYNQEILYYERVAISRAGDSGRDIHTLHQNISFLKDYSEEFYKKIYKLYSINNDAVPKWLLRDAYKLGFLDWNNQGSVMSSKQDINWINNNLREHNNVYFLNVGIFFTTETLKNELKKLNDIFELELEIDDVDEIHKIFLDRNKILQTHKNTDIVLNAVYNNENIDIPPLDIIQQSFVYAELEKKYDFITMPLCEHFFRNTKEIIDYVILYPSHYKAINPNLPTFNNIPNPFFLHRQNKK